MLDELLDEVIDVLEFVGCQFRHCDGPTLEPVAMVTCNRCSLLAKCRASAGRAPRLPDELTANQQIRWRDEIYAAQCSRRPLPTFEEFIERVPV